MTPASRALTPAMSRRAFLRGGGVLIVSFASGGLGDLGARAQGRAAGAGGAVDPRQLDSWLAIGADGTVTAHTGKCAARACLPRSCSSLPKSCRCRSPGFS